MGRRERERELKFSPEPGFRADEAIAGLDSVRVGDPDVRTLHATYYDTADLRLARAGSSLRWRDDQGWMVKLPAPGGGDGLLARDELAVTGAPGTPPAEALDLVTSLTRGAPVDAVAELVTVRNRVDLFDGAGEPLAELVDDEVSVLHHGELTTRFREVELELAADAHAERAAAIVNALAAGAGEPDPVPKIVRALGPLAAGAPDLLPPGALDEASTPAEVLRAALARSTRRLVTHDPGVRLGIDAEDVHQARVATRRLRSDLRTFRAVVDPDWDAALRCELKWLGDLLGAVRDTDVLLDRLERRLTTLDDADADAGHTLLDGLHATRDAARVELLAALRSPRYVALLDTLYEACHRIPGPPDASDLDVEVADVVRRPWRRLRRAADALTDDSPDPELHHVRILAKRCRYAAEAVAPALGSDAANFASRVADLQDVLGEHQDAVIAGRWLHEHARDGMSFEAAFVAGELAMLEQAAAEASRELWPGTWRAARARCLRRWM
jgi:CHAD domain-containing protein